MPFPLMKLPAELRLFIFEYSMAHDQDLYWCWKSEAPGRRIGHFVSTLTIYWPGSHITKQSRTEENAGHNIITRLHVSRQLQAETQHLWEKFAILHFDGQDVAPDSPTPCPWSYHIFADLERAILAYKFFVHHPRVRNTPRVPRLVIHATEDLNRQIYRYPLRDLLVNNQLSHDPRISDMRLVVQDGHTLANLAVAGGIVGCEGYFRRMVESLDAHYGLSHRRFRIFPDPELKKHVEELPRGEMDDKEREAVMNLLQNGVYVEVRAGVRDGSVVSKAIPF